MLSVVNDAGSTPDGFLIDEIVREGARRMPTAALEAEVDAYIAEPADQKDERGRLLVVRNGNAPHLVALVRAGARFERGRLIGRSEAAEA